MIPINKKLVAALRIVVEAKTKILYHGTNKKRLPSIEKEGLSPKAEKASSGEDFVYLTDSPEVAAQFSGYGKDSQGYMREGYMAPIEAKRQSGVVLKVRVDDKGLELDQIWQNKLKEMGNPKEIYKQTYDSIKDDIDGNQVLEFYVEEEVHRLWKEVAEDDDEYDPYFAFEDFGDEAVHLVADRMAKKESEKVLQELNKFKKGTLYQYPKKIDPKDILEVIPAKKFLKDKKDDTKYFGNPLQIQEFGDEY